MASTHVSNASKGPNGAPPPPIRRGRKAPEEAASEQEAVAAAMAAEEAAPDPTTPGDETGPPTEFWELLTSFGADDWGQNLMVYVYRTAPKIDRRRSNQSLYIAMYTEPFNEQRLMLDEGSGGYRLDLLRRNPQTGRTGRIFRSYVTILNLKFPPKVPPGEWIEDPSNNMWKWGEPGLQTAPGQPAAAGPALDPNKMFTTVLDGVERFANLSNAKNHGSDGLTAALVGQVGELQKTVMVLTDPSRMFTLAQQMAQTMMPAKTSLADDPFVQLVLAQLKETREELRAARGQNNKGIFEQLDEFLPKLTKYGQALGLKRGDSTSDMAQVLEKTVDMIGPHVGSIIDAFTTRGERAPGQANGGFQIGGGQQGKQAQQQPSTQQTQAQPEAEPPTPLDDETQGKLQGILNEFGNVIRAVVPFMIDQFKDPDLTGYDFRDWFIRRQGLNWWTALREKAGAHLLTLLTQQHPILRAQLTPSEKLEPWFAEFFTPQSEGPEPLDADQQQTGA